MAILADQAAQDRVDRDLQSICPGDAGFRHPHRWGTVQRLLADYAPAFLEDDQERFEWARNVVKEALDTLLGSKDIDYTTEKRAGDKVWIKVKRRPASNTAQDDLFETESRDDEPPF